MSVVIAVAAAFGLVGFGMLVSPEMARLRKRRRERKRETAPAPLRTVPERLHAVPDDDQPRPSLHVIHGDGGTVVPFRPRQAETFASGPPSNPLGDGPDAA